MRLVNMTWVHPDGRIMTTDRPRPVESVIEAIEILPTEARLINIIDVTTEYFCDGSPRSLWMNLTRLNLAYEQKYLICGLIDKAIKGESLSKIYGTPDNAPYVSDLRRDARKKATAAKRKGRAKASATATA